MPSSSSPSLADFSTCELSDALVKIGLPHGGFIPDMNMFSPHSGASNMRICGPAYTVQMVPASDKSSPRPPAHFVDTAPQGSVIVIDAPPQTKNAVWGGLMTAGAQARGAVGVVISGRCRDLAEHRSAGFPVFARGHSTLGQSPFTRPSAVNVPLTIQPQFSSDAFKVTFEAVHVEPGDYVVADEDGVVCVPVGLVDRVLELAAKGREIDARCMTDIVAGSGVQEAFKRHRGKL
ncbi:ribonuclease E inhibitor RraA/Dimethylmenaquinone methyltransferase [Rhodofomes roseus]|uniref:Ribonuclease E inhibitor RraA/Dimethylmenaquinone methyltransferase n=1 Tax=Rhodofomes roseus TaxID=34475 RepID=A0ABQ8KN38_9APHY|nr:ribonuclease E inhibitor RraA/Dimethylmenaquinone methyltransferase [Rhodofomes roseus]KAH9839300.1 ribonuclease E inhibitor RraA/Dimethylmenaquinone methyltransferase [Rhodofomes roseus]